MMCCEYGPWCQCFPHHNHLAVMVFHPSAIFEFEARIDNVTAFNFTRRLLTILANIKLGRGAQKLTVENLKVVWTEFSILSWAILLCVKLHGLYKQGRV